MCDCNCGCEWCDPVEYEDPYELIEKIGEGTTTSPITNILCDYEIWTIRHKETGEIGQRFYSGVNIKMKGFPEK